MKDISEVQLVMMDSADPKAQAEASARLEKLFEELKQAPAGPAKPKQTGKVTPAPAKAEGWTNPLAGASNDGDWDGWDQGEPAWTDETPAPTPAPAPAKKQGWDDWGEGDEDVFEVPTVAPAAVPAKDTTKKSDSDWNSKDDNWDKW